MQAYKFLHPGRIGPFSGYAWPTGVWVEGDGKLCARGIHACRIDDLPFWVDHELWVVELDGEITTGLHKIAAPRGKLLDRVEGWNAATYREFAAAALERARPIARESDLLEDAMRAFANGRYASTAYIAAHAGGTEAAYFHERSLQAEWLRERLDLR